MLRITRRIPLNGKSTASRSNITLREPWFQRWKILETFVFNDIRSEIRRTNGRL